MSETITNQNVPPLSSMPLLPITSRDTIDMCKALPLCSNDVFICSYPKSGTTWTQHIVLTLLFRHKFNIRSYQGNPNQTQTNTKYHNCYNHVSEYAPFYEIDAHWDTSTRNLLTSIQHNHEYLGRRVFNTHLRWDMLPSDAAAASTANDHGKCGKFIYLVRNPLDVCVSFYFHLSHQVEGGYNGTFDDFFQEWVRGETAFGSWIDHILSFAQVFADSKPLTPCVFQCVDGREILLLSYEEMISNLPLAVKRLVTFLDLYSIDDDQLQNELLPTFVFEYMKGELTKFQPRSVQWKNGFEFLRKGIAGDSVSVVTQDQVKLFRDSIQKHNVLEFLSQLLRGESQQHVYERLRSLVQGEIGRDSASSKP